VPRLRGTKGGTIRTTGIGLFWNPLLNRGKEDKGKGSGSPDDRSGGGTEPQGGKALGSGRSREQRQEANRNAGAERLAQRSQTSGNSDKSRIECWSKTCCECGRTYISAVGRIPNNHWIERPTHKYPDAYLCWLCRR